MDHKGVIQMDKIMVVAALTAVGLAMGMMGCRAAGGYQSISQEDAKSRMGKPGVVVIDVREPAEYKEGHIPGAVLLPLGTIGEKTAAAAIPSKDTEVLVYCKSGVRSKKGAEKLSQLGYTNINEFGGIMTWPYEIEK